MPILQISKKPAVGKMVIPKGARFRKLFIFKNADMSLYDLTGCSFEAQIRKTRLSDVVVAELSFELDIPNGTVFYWIPAADSAEIEAGETEYHRESQYVIDFLWTRPGEEPTRFLQADCIISQGVTR